MSLVNKAHGFDSAVVLTQLVIMSVCDLIDEDVAEKTMFGRFILLLDAPKSRSLYLGQLFFIPQ